ncbi:MAG: adenine-specific methyltransferase EcoRI family protein, partial [Marinilabiliaceae bacterium]|nr:adenine-specific methyltransferase EcoRI family protein [Marinilabiliaceae bacterium]
FKGKVVYCNCDDPYESNFFKYFAMNFDFLGLKKLIATCYIGSPIANKQLSLFDNESAENKTTRNPHKIEITEIPDINQDGAVDLADVKLLLASDRNHLTRLEGDGDFRSKECIDLLKQADIVVTNPPFSLFREFVAQLIQYDKEFLIIGSDDCRTYKDVFIHIKENKMWCGYTRVKEFMQPDGSIKNFGKIGWYTNLDVSIRHKSIVLYKEYNSNDHPKYDNYDAIEVSKISDIPCDYEGVMGVPVTFLDKYNPNQFEILGSNRGVDQDPNKIFGRGTLLNGKETFKRIFIKHKKL